MDIVAQSMEARAGKDRRLLPRADNGRREPDRAERELITTEQEPALGFGESAVKYMLLMAMVFVIGLTAVHSANTQLAPLLNSDAKATEIGKVLASGKTYLTYDLNIETRRMKASMIENLDRVPELAVLGASHWQEGHSSIARHVDMFNAHVHRDYYEDILGVTESFVRAGKLPKKMVITIRDNQFKPVEDRTDFLWVPGLGDYRAMAQRLGLPYHNAYADGLTPQLRQKLSLPLLKANIERYLAAPVKPKVSDLEGHPTLDTLLPDGSIIWSTIHQQAFTQGRSRTEALSHAYGLRENPPKIDPLGLRSVDAMLAYLVERGVEVYLAHPPFNPIFWDAVQGSPYAEALEEIEQTTQDLADKYGLEVIGSFNPSDVGCTEDMYIDGEHSNTECLGKVIHQFLALDWAKRA